MEITIIKTNKKGKVVENKVNLKKIVKQVGLPMAYVACSSFTGYAEGTFDLGAAFDPMIDMLRSLAKPVSIAFMTKGFLQITSGEEHKGKKTIKYALTGFAGIMLVPHLMDKFEIAVREAMKK